MSQLQKIYDQIKAKNPSLDDARARQQAWIMRDRMILENTAVSSSAGAAGAGGGGGSGGFRKRTQDASFNNYVENGYIDNYFE
jgi:hypothetical protein